MHDTYVKNNIQGNNIQDNKICEFLLATYMSQGIGPATIQKLLKIHRNDIHSVYHSLKNPCSLYTAHKQIERAQKLDIKIITDATNAYSPVLYYKGNINILNNTKIMAIVGSRHPSHASIALTEHIAKSLHNKITVVSGLAHGIDQQAHLHSMKSIGVFATGMDNIYPKSATNVCEKIIDQGGLLISECPIGVTAIPKLFARRNRFLAHMASMGIIVIEAKYKSGTMMTARYGIKMKREIYAVPGHPLDHRFHGCNALISQGAKIIDKPNYFYENIQSEYIQSESMISDIQMHNTSNDSINNNINDNINDKKHHNHMYKKILQLVSDTPTEIEYIAQNINIPYEELKILLTKMYLDGYICINGNEITYNRK